MMEPIRSSLSTLLYNSVTLAGSVAMCYYTSYQLAMLAFVTVSARGCPHAAQNPLFVVKL